MGTKLDVRLCSRRASVPMHQDMAQAANSALESALHASGFVGMWETDIRTGTVHLSGPLSRLLGLRAKDAVDGVPVSAFLAGIHMEDRDRIAALVHEAHETAGRFEAEFRTLGIHGIERYVTARGQVEKDKQGNGIRCLGIVVDVTDTRQGDGPEQTMKVLNQVVDTIIAVRRTVDTLNIPILKTLADMMLFQLGTELARRGEHGELRQVH